MRHWTDVYEGTGKIPPKFEIRSIPNDNGENTKAILIKGEVIRDEPLKEKIIALSITNLKGFVYKRFANEIESTLGQYPPKFLFGYDDENVYICDDISVKDSKNIITKPVGEVKDFQKIKEIFDNPDENSSQELQELLLPLEKSYTNTEKAVI